MSETSSERASERAFPCVALDAPIVLSISNSNSNSHFSIQHATLPGHVAPPDWQSRNMQRQHIRYRFKQAEEFFSFSTLSQWVCKRERERERLKKRVWMRIIFIFGFKFYLWDIELNCIYIRILNLLIAYLLLISSISHPINNSFPNLLILQFQLQLDPPWYSLIRLG